MTPTALTTTLRALREAFHFMRGNVLVFAVTDVLGNFCRRMVFPYASLYILALHGDSRQVGLVNALMPLAGLVILPIGGYLADHAGRVRLVVLSNYFQVGVLLLYIFAPRWEVVAAASLLLGVTALQFPASSALIADSLAPEDRGKGVATMNLIASLPAIFAPYIGGRVVDLYRPDIGLRILYTVMMASTLLIATIQLRGLRETVARPWGPLGLSNLPQILRKAYRSAPDTLRRLPRPLKALTGVIVLTIVANGIMSPYWVVYATQQIGLSPSQWGLILVMDLALQVLLFIPAGVLADRYGRARSLLMALSLSLVAIPAFVFARGFLAVLAVRVTIAVAYVTALPACAALLADLVPSEMRGRVMAAIGQGSIMIGPAGGGTGGPSAGFVVTIPLIIALLGGGYLYALNPRYPWYLVGAMTALSVLLTALFIRDPHQAEV